MRSNNIQQNQLDADLNQLLVQRKPNIGEHTYKTLMHRIGDSEAFDAILILLDAKIANTVVRACSLDSDSERSRCLERVAALNELRKQFCQDCGRSSRNPEKRIEQ